MGEQSQIYGEETGGNTQGTGKGTCGKGNLTKKQGASLMKRL